MGCTRVKGHATRGQNMNKYDYYLYPVDSIELVFREDEQLKN